MKCLIVTVSDILIVSFITCQNHFQFFASFSRKCKFSVNQYLLFCWNQFLYFHFFSYVLVALLHYLGCNDWNTSTLSLLNRQTRLYEISIMKIKWNFRYPFHTHTSYVKYLWKYFFYAMHPFEIWASSTKKFPIHCEPYLYFLPLIRPLFSSCHPFKAFTSGR